MPHLRNTGSRLFTVRAFSGRRKSVQNGDTRVEFIRMGWFKRRTQRKALNRLFSEFREPLPTLPSGDQEFSSDPLWQIAHFTEDWWRCGEISPVLKRVVRETLHLKDVRLPILAFFGSCGGKSGPSFSLEEFAFTKLHEPESEWSIGFETNEHWAQNIASYEARFASRWPNAFYFRWSQRLYLGNDDQSHHFAAIYRQAKTQNRSWHVPCNLRIFELRTDVENDAARPIFFSCQHPVNALDDLHWAGLRLEILPIDRFEFQLHAVRVNDVTPELNGFVQALIERAEKNRTICRLRNLGTWWAESKPALGVDSDGHEERKSEFVEFAG